MQIEMDKNLIVVAAIEGYSSKHDMPAVEVFDLFKEYNIIELLRSQYEVLHTQSLDEGVAFAEDIMARRTQ
jgi:hypothetical protein